MEVPKSDLLKFITYLDDAARLYAALAVLPAQKCASRHYMICRLIQKYKSKLKESDGKS